MVFDMRDTTVPYGHIDGQTSHQVIRLSYYGKSWYMTDRQGNWLEHNEPR
jgi:hypothetical protein